jgi:hypothetical protein
MDATQLDFDKLIQEMKAKEPNLYQILIDYLNKKLSFDELNELFSLEGGAWWAFVDSYQAR